MLHANELPLRHVFNELDGGFGTSGPDSFKGPMGQRLAGDIHLESVVPFKEILSKVKVISDSVQNDLSQDQELLYKYSRAVSSGTLASNLAKRKPGPPNHSRWLTLALRILILYTRTTNPDTQLIRLVTFVQQVYVVMWFDIKSNPKFTMGAIHLHRMMELIMEQPEDVNKICAKVVQNNAYISHQKNVLPAMLEDQDETIRRKAVNKIIEVRQQKVEKVMAKKAMGIRWFKPPSLVWNSPNYVNMFSWDTVDITEPAVTMKMTDDELLVAYLKPLNFPLYSCHSQSVER